MQCACVSVSVPVYIGVLIVSCLLPDIKCSLYVDDLAIYYSSSHMPSIERKLQHSLNRLGQWCDEKVFTNKNYVCSFLSTTKTSF